MKILVMCPSRERPGQLSTMVESVVSRSSENVELAAYIDADEYYAYPLSLPRTKIMYGPRIGPVASYNTLVKNNPGYDVYGAVTDDSRFETDNWEEWVGKVVAGFKNGVGCLAPYVRDSGRMDFPWATAKWIEVLGYFALKTCKHYYWDVAMELLGQCSQIAYADPYDFRIVHLGSPYMCEPETVLLDSRTLTSWTVWERLRDIRVLREASGLPPINESVPDRLAKGEHPNICWTPPHAMIE